jgi:hypothetical protein
VTTYYDGLKVPAMTQDFAYAMTDGNGDIVVDLSYVPKQGMYSIIVYAKHITWNDRALLGLPQSLVDKTLTVRFFEIDYSKSNTPTATTDAAGGGAVVEPHSHALAYTTTRTTLVPVVTVVIGYSISYEPTGGS